MCDLLRRDTQEVSCLRCVSPLLPFSHEVASDSWWPHGRQHSSVFSPPILPRVCSNSCPLSRWCCITISFSVAPCSFWLQSFRTSGSFPVSWLFTSDGQSKLQHQFFHYSGLISFRTDWFNLLAVQGTLKGLLQKKNKRREWVFSSITIQKHQFLAVSRLYGVSVKTILFHSYSWLTVGLDMEMWVGSQFPLELWRHCSPVFLFPCCCSKGWGHCFLDLQTCPSLHHHQDTDLSLTVKISPMLPL